MYDLNELGVWGSLWCKLGPRFEIMYDIHKGGVNGTSPSPTASNEFISRGEMYLYGFVCTTLFF